IIMTNTIDIDSENLIRDLFNTGDPLNENAFNKLINHIGRKSILEIADIMSPTQIEEALSDEGTDAESLWSEALDLMSNGMCVMRWPPGQFNFSSAKHLHRRLHIIGQAFPQQHGNLPTSRPTRF